MEESYFSNQPVHIAKMLLLDRNVQALLREVEKLMIANIDCKNVIRELQSDSESYVSHAELLAAVAGRKAKPVEKATTSESSMSNERAEDIARSVSSISKYIFA